MIIGYSTNAPALRPLMTVLDGYLMTAAEVGEHLRYSTERLAHLRADGRGPPFIKLPTGGVRYQMAEVTAWQLAAECGPLTLDRVALAVAACVSVPAEQRAAIIQHLEASFKPEVRK
ncbi:MAG: helix-turn-helix transcriptional regulator [Saprospiraceae bacterium]